MKLNEKINNIIFNNFTIMIIPKTNKKTKQIKLNSIMTYSAIIGFILLNVFVSITSIVFFNKSHSLDATNQDLTTKLSSNIAVLNSLGQETSLKNDKIIELTDENKEVIEYLNTRIKEVDSLTANLTSAISNFNEENDSDISLPISRSLDRTLLEDIYEMKNVDDKNSSEDLNELEKRDELTEVIANLNNLSIDLVNEIEAELEYLDCLPDYVPIEGRISSGFGYRIHPITGLRSFHYGIDITNNRGTPVHAAGSGVIVYSGYSGGFGKILIISHGYGYETVYAHNDTLFVSVGDIVNKGDIISEVGNTGDSTGPHLHFEIHVDNKPVDPRSILKFN